MLRFVTVVIITGHTVKLLKKDRVSDEVRRQISQFTVYILKHVVLWNRTS